ncbi:MAG TPA: hypothetical protein ENK32_10360, partial [Anaerolineae bacterium]|nr:hypothetical protein [Anaerolineae bacterium]
MKAKHSSSIFIFIIVTLFAILAARPLTLWAEPASRAARAAWRQANDVGQYRFAAEINQTTRPLPTLVNAGKGSQTERIYLEGSADTAAETMNLKLWAEGGSAALGQGAIEMRVAGGRALGRVNDGPWQEVDNATNFFAPGGDPLQFLNAAEQISEAGRESRAGISFTRYTFLINSDTFARQMRRQFEEQLAQDGAPLPPGIQLDIPRLYAGMDARGELWIGDDGLPLRQIITLEFPPAGQEQVSAEITTDFTGWGAPATPSALSGRATAVFWQIRPRLADLALSAIPYLFLLALSAVLLFSRRQKLLYAILAVALSLIMVASPLLQGQRVYAFNQYYSQLQAKQSPPEKAENRPPAAGNRLPAAAPLAGPALQTTAATTDTLDLFYDDGLDEDDDGLSNAQETEFYGTDPRLADSDGDGLDDGVEINELGTSPLNADSDGDNLPDLAEVQGVVMPDGSRWYLDPLAGDSGGNGEADGAACRMIDTNNDNTPDTLDCPDTDGDNVPDVFDLDNDDDGVPDTVDSAPFSFMGDPAAGLISRTFQLDLDNVTAAEPLYVDFQLRPANPDHLWYSLSKLDWPENDSLGQVQSVLTTTFKNGEPGDMRLIPLLEVEMSGAPLPLPLTNPQASLTFSDVVSGTAVFTQQGSDVELSLALSGAGQYGAAVYNAACAAIDNATPPLYDLGSMGDGDTAVIPGINLPQTIAGGGHSLRLTDAAGQAECRAIPNVVNGAYPDRMVDLAALQNYGISVREKDNAGTVLVYVPLTLLYEQAGNVPVAFAGRLYLQPDQADFGAPAQTRLVWLVMTRTDRCLPMPDNFDPDPNRADETEAEKVQAWCANPANWAENGPTAVHAYDDDWLLTGLTVQRNLGLKTAVVYEDPAYTAAQPGYDPNGFNDD